MTGIACLPFLCGKTMCVDKVLSNFIPRLNQEKRIQISVCSGDNWIFFNRAVLFNVTIWGSAPLFSSKICNSHLFKMLIATFGKNHLPQTWKEALNYIIINLILDILFIQINQCSELFCKKMTSKYQCDQYQLGIKNLERKREKEMKKKRERVK